MGKSKKLSLMMKAYILFWSFAFFITPVHAYIDPSVMTYAIQAVAGIAIALGAVLGVYWRKILKLFRKIFHLESKKVKNTESDDIVFMDPVLGQAVRPDDRPVMETTVHEELPQKEIVVRQAEAPRPSRKAVFIEGLIGFLASAAVVSGFSYMLLYYAPLEMFLNNLTEFWFTFETMEPLIRSTAIAIGITGILLFLVLSLTGRKIFNASLIILLTAYASLYIQGNYFSGKLPPTNGETIVWAQFYDQYVISYIVILAAASVILIVYRLAGKKQFYAFSCFIAVLISGMLAAAQTTLVEEKKDLTFSQMPHVTTNYNEWVYSSDKNVIILMLDAIDAELFTQVLANEPALTQGLADFTYYPDTMGAYPFTSRAVPFVLSGQWYENQEEYTRFESLAMHNSPFLSRLGSEGYVMDVYEQDFLYDTDYSRYENIIFDEPKISNDNEFRKLMFDLAWFKYAPFSLKQYADFDMSKFAALQELDGIESDLDADVYDWVDTDFNNAVFSQEIALRNEKVFKFIHLEGAHVPFYYDEEFNPVNAKVGSYYKKVVACARMVTRYVQKLKDYGLYDQSVIVVMSDHGYNYDYNAKQCRGADGRNNPLLMIKGFDEHHEFRTSGDVVSFDDLQQAYARLLDGMHSQELFDYKEGSARERRFLQFTYTEENHMEEYMQTGFAADWSTMVPTGVSYDYEDKKAAADEKSPSAETDGE